MFDTTQHSYKAFRDIAAERTKSVIVWVGAGLSKPAGLPLWSELRSHLCEVGHSKAKQLTDPTERQRLTTKCDVAKTLSLWNAFGLLRSVLGKTTYTETIKHSLSPAETAVVPIIYKKIWDLRPSGILNLNLDRLATRAHRESQPQRGVNESIGRQITGNFGLLKASLPFILYLHGTVSDAKSWVMTDDELKSLFATPGYRDFITACFASRTVLFVGMSADDVAAGGHLEQLTARGIDTGQHFWLTSRADAATDVWAEQAGIRTICYHSKGESHTELAEFFDDILSFLPQEQFAPPVALASAAATAPSAPLPSPEELVKVVNPDEIRTLLNARAVEILREPTPEAYAEFDRFSQSYDQAIWRAWYISTAPPTNRLLGFTLLKAIAKGAFGTVYLAKRDGSADDVAIKVLHHDIRRDPQLLQSFRRGVRSMEILSTSDISGMIPYREASEIPAFAVMDYIEGPNLTKAVKDGDVQSWADVLTVGLSLASIIKAAHELPERVLHRDIRPANIMLRHFQRSDSTFDVVVLDFDLSWHRGASELSIMAPQAVSGFLAPEQVNRDERVSTRHAAVDSFGLGMTLYFLRCGQEPMFSHHMHVDWLDTLRKNISGVKCETWKSLPQRFARLIAASTKQRQAERWDMSQIVGELERLKSAETGPRQVKSAEMFAEELARSSAIRDDYIWDADRNQAIHDKHGTIFIIRGIEPLGQIEVDFTWSSNRGPKVDKYIKTASEKAAAELKKGRWVSPIVDVKADGARVTSKISVGQLRQNGLSDAVRALDAAFEAFTVH